MSNDESIDRLAHALTEYRELLPADHGLQHDFLLRIARKYRIRPALMRQSVQMLYDLEQIEADNEEHNRYLTDLEDES